ncbi:MAG: hypothetical protein N2491_13740, partial [Negativicutes bacterium]|nr:hypothetical protein [Negativicutes bacterium]
MITRMLGFGFWTGWLWALFLEGPLLAPTAERWQIEAGSMFLLFMLFNAVGLLYLGAKLHPRSLPDRGMLLAVSAGMMLLCPLLLALLPYFIQSRAIWLNLILVSVSGLSASVLGGSWLESFSRMNVGDTAAVIAGAVIIAGIGTILTATVPYFMGMSAGALMPAVSYLLLKKQL